MALFLAGLLTTAQLLFALALKVLGALTVLRWQRNYIKGDTV